MKLIDKDALVAEIWKRISFNGTLNAHSRLDECNAILSFIDTLEVKEVDLEHEVEFYWKQCDMTWCRDAYSMTHIRSMLSDIAKHFFELGLNASNPLTWEDMKLIWNITDEMDNMPEEEFYQEVLKRFKAQKGDIV